MRLRRHETIKNFELLDWVRKLAFIDISLVPLRPPRLNLRRRLLGPLLSPLSLLRAHCANSNFRVPSSTDWRLNFLAYALPVATGRRKAKGEVQGETRRNRDLLELSRRHLFRLLMRSPARVAAALRPARRVAAWASESSQRHLQCHTCQPSRLCQTSALV